MRKSIGATAAALVVAGTAFMACGGTSGYEKIQGQSYFHAVINCTQTEIRLRVRQGIEVTEEDRRKIEWECKAGVRG